MNGLGKGKNKMNYKISGLRIGKKELDLCSPYRYITYHALFCKIAIATDDWGTQICYNGRFFGKMGFRNLEDAVEYLRENKEEAVKYFRKCYFERIKRAYFTRQGLQRTIEHQYWKIRHHFNPEFYLVGDDDIFWRFRNFKKSLGINF